uniref:Wsv131-like protein n=1 Tax=Penaeus semisulcatus majanivirus TaxID=2984274 RepID=A0A9C7F6M9_9VIRU|nr:MAG: wsv131-like protein [Penaeus semisulcatus majanivirus]
MCTHMHVTVIITTTINMAYNTSQIDSSLTVDDVGYLSLLKHGELDVDKNESDHRFTRMELSDISHLNNAMTIFQNDTIKRRLRYMITSNDASKTIENVISINNKRSSSFPNIFKKITYYMMQDMIHSVIFSSSVSSLSSKSSSSSPLQSQYSSSDSSSNHNSSINTVYNNINNNNYKLFLNLSKHTSRVSARDVYADDNNNSNSNIEDDDNSNNNNNNSNNTDGNLSECFLFGFSPESELLKNLIAVINVTASLFISSINVLEHDIRKRHDALCQTGREIEYAHMLRDVKQLKSVSAATYNFIRNVNVLCKKATVCSCCGSKSHTQSPLVDKTRKLYDNSNVTLNSNNITSNKKKETNILVPPEMMFKGMKKVKKTSISPSSSTSSSVRLQIGMKKSNGRIRTAIDKQIKSALSNMRDIKYRQMYNPIATPTSTSTTLTEVKQQRSSETTTTTSSFSHNFFFFFFFFFFIS